jgi:Cu-processing system ATP-binding protein
MTAVVTLDSVTKRYGKEAAVNEVTLELDRGQCIALVGHNGAGKTTLIKMMLGVTHPTSGRIRVLGEDPLSHAGQQARLQIGYLPESVAFPPALTGLEMLRFYARLKRRPTAECEELLTRVGLAEAARKRIGAYSKGMRQRLGLAQALLGSPRLLFLDEPTTGLDPFLRRSFYSIIAELRDRGVTAVLSSHALSELETRVDRIVVLHRGRALVTGTLDSLRAMARLPTVFRLRLRNGLAGTVPAVFEGLAAGSVAADGAIELSCAADRKMEVLRRAQAIQGLDDIEILSPSLDQLYASFLQDHQAMT